MLIKRLGVLALLAFSATGRADDPHPAAARDARHVDAIRAAAKAYATWGRVDERPNIAPGLCRAPLPRDHGAPARVRRSAADAAPHGKKLYFLYASDRGRGRYLDNDAAVPVGFSIVKESFAAVPTKDAAAPEVHDESPGVPPPVTTVVDDDGHRLELGARKDLFVMVKVGDVAGSDGGWIYGTVAPDGAVTSAGRVASCMGCHDEAATREKLFGLRPSPAP